MPGPGLYDIVVYITLYIIRCTFIRTVYYLNEVYDIYVPYIIYDLSASWARIRTGAFHHMTQCLDWPSQSRSRSISSISYKKNNFVRKSDISTKAKLGVSVSKLYTSENITRLLTFAQYKPYSQAKRVGSLPLCPYTRDQSTSPA